MKLTKAYVESLFYGLGIGFLSPFRLISRKIHEYRRSFIIFAAGATEAFILFNFSDDLRSFFELHNEWIGPSTVAMLIASPIAYLIWSFRNSDKKRELQHSDENIRQNDFHKIEEWATLFAESDDKQKNTLQIAAIHQILPYLKGEHGIRFVRPSMEIYRSLLYSWNLTDDDLSFCSSYGYMLKPGYIKALHAIFNEESHFFRKFGEKNKFYINHWNPLDTLELKGIVLQIAFFSSVRMQYVNFQYASFYGVDFQSADLRSANFRNTLIFSANFNRSILKKAEFVEANLISVNFDGADLEEADFTGALNMTPETFKGAKNLEKAIGIEFE